MVQVYTQETAALLANRMIDNIRTPTAKHNAHDIRTPTSKAQAATFNTQQRLTQVWMTEDLRLCY
jgi:hypothetical protein